MTRYIIRRLLQAIPLLFIVSLILFALMSSIGDPLSMMGGRNPTRPEDRQRLARQLGLDQPLMVQYLYWLIGNDWVMIDVTGDGEPDTYGRRQGVLRGDFGVSMVTRGKPALEIIWERVPNTLLLMIPAQIIILVLGLIVGVYSALRQYSWIDNTITTLSFVGFSMPIFLIALLSIYVFAILFQRWGLPSLPANGMFDPQVGKTTAQVAKHMILPVFSIAFIDVARYSRYIRSSMLEVMGQDYIRTARAKGLKRVYIITVHALRNASLPIVTLIGLDLPFLLAGAVVTERIFAWPGMGRLFLDHLQRADGAVVMGIVILLAAAVILSQLVTDIVYAILDPRIRYD
ncbi:MAG: ABC transporter permease [Chloroflexota bacterium]|jgi:peptide/nickel transport system permease protein